MKSIIKYIIGGMGLLSITSCSDFLDQSSPSEIKGDMVFNSLTFTEQSLNKVYAGLTLDHTYGARIPLNFGFMPVSLLCVPAIKNSEPPQLLVLTPSCKMGSITSCLALLTLLPSLSAMNRCL